MQSHTEVWIWLNDWIYATVWIQSWMRSLYSCTWLRLLCGPETTKQNNNTNHDWHSRNGKLMIPMYLDNNWQTQESPHEHQQTLLLSRIINNIVCQMHIWRSGATMLTTAGETEWVCDGDEQESPGMITPVLLSSHLPVPFAHKCRTSTFKTWTSNWWRRCSRTTSPTSSSTWKVSSDSSCLSGSKLMQRIATENLKEPSWGRVMYGWFRYEDMIYRIWIVWINGRVWAIWIYHFLHSVYFYEFFLYFCL